MYIMLCDIFGRIENSSLSEIYKNKERNKKKKKKKLGPWEESSLSNVVLSFLPFIF